MSNKKPEFGSGKVFIKQRTDFYGKETKNPKTYSVECESISLDISSDHDDMIGRGVFLQSTERKKITLSGRISGLFSKQLLGEICGMHSDLSYSVKMYTAPAGGINAPEPGCKISQESTGLDIMHDCGVFDSNGMRLSSSAKPVIGEYFFDGAENSYHFPIGGTYYPTFLYRDHSSPSRQINIDDVLQGEPPTFSLIYCGSHDGEMTTINLSLISFPKISAISAKVGDFSAGLLEFLCAFDESIDSAGFICDYKMINQHLFNFDRYLLKINNNFPSGSNVVYDVTGNASLSNSGQIFTSAYLENGITTINTNSAGIVASSLDVPSSQYSAGMTIDFFWRPPTTFDIAVFFAWGQSNGAGNCPSLTYSSTFQKFFLSDGVVNYIDINKTLSSLSGKFNRITLFFSMNASGAINNADLYVDKVLIASGSIASPGYVSAGYNMAIMSGLGSAGVGHHAEFSISRGRAFPY